MIPRRNFNDKTLPAILDYAREFYKQKRALTSIMPDAEYQIVTLKRAVARHGVVCRTRTNRGSARVDVFWRPPRVKRNMRPFTSAMPLPLIRDLQRNGFTPVNGVPISGLFEHGIVAASFASDARDAAQLARAVLDSHGLAKSDRVVAWAPSSGGSGAAVEQSGAPL
jgi:hypothetical protein